MGTRYYTAASLDGFIATEDDSLDQFYDAGLLDEIIVQLGSVTLGRGKPLFPRRLENSSLELVTARRIGRGFAKLRYRVAGTA